MVIVLTSQIKTCKIIVFQRERNFRTANEVLCHLLDQLDFFIPLWSMVYVYLLAPLLSVGSLTDGPDKSTYSLKIWLHFDTDILLELGSAMGDIAVHVIYCLDWRQVSSGDGEANFSCSDCSLEMLLVFCSAFMTLTNYLFL